MSWKYFLVLLLLLQFSCSNGNLEFCDRYKEDYKVEYTNKDFLGCLFADSKGDMVLLSKDKFDYVQLHPDKGNYTQPISVQKEGDVWKYIFSPIHNRKMNLVTGQRGFPGEVYSLKLNGKAYRFSVADPEKLEKYQFQLLRPDWKNVKPDTSSIKYSHSSIERSTYELAVGGINLIVYPFKDKDSLYLNLRIINHSNNTVVLFSPQKISGGIISSDADSTLIKAGERFGGKFSFQTDYDKKILIDNDLIRIYQNQRLKPFLKNDIPLVMDHSEIF